MKSLFITLEGTEGSGKTTQVRNLADHFNAAGRKVVCCREPGGTALGEELRHLTKSYDMEPETELLMMNAARRQLIHEVIQPALDVDAVVLCDRFTDSTTAYQGFGRKLDLGYVSFINNFATGGLRPDATFYLRVPVLVSEERAALRRAADKGLSIPDRIGEEQRDFFLRVEKGYETLARTALDRIITIDGTKDPAHVFQDIWAVLQTRFPKQFLVTS